MKTISVSELMAWRESKRKHHWAYVERLQLPSVGVPQPAQGIAVHAGIEAVMAGVESVDTCVDYALEVFRSFTESDDDSKRYDRFSPGVQHCLEVVPQWVWNQEWLSEELLEVDLGGLSLYGTPIVRVRFKPDLYTVTDDFINIVDIKTTGSNPMDALNRYLFNSPQLRWYGVLLNKVYPGRTIQYSYVVLPTSNKYRVAEQQWPLNQVMLERFEAEMLGLAYEVVQDGNMEDKTCTCGMFCDFKALCDLWLTGGEIGGMIAEDYSIREATR